MAIDIRLEVLDGWAKIEKVVPEDECEPDRLPEYLADTTGVQRHHIVAARHVRNRIAHEAVDSVPLDELERAAVTIRQIKTGLGLEDSGDPARAFAIPEISDSISAHHEGIDPRFAAHWREEMGSNDILEWHLRLNGSFAARVIRLKNPLYHLNLRKWYGEWRVYLNDPAGPWMELIATDLDSPAIGLLGVLAGQSKTPRESLDRLTRSADITSHTHREFTLSWSGYNRKRRYTSIWKML